MRKIEMIEYICLQCKKHFFKSKNYKKGKIKPRFCRQECHYKYVREHSEEYFERLSKAGKIGTKKHGGWTSFHKIFKEKNPEKYHLILVDAGKKANIKCKEENPEKYHTQRVNSGNMAAKKNNGWATYNKEFRQKYPEKYHIQRINICSKAGKLGGPAAEKSRRENSPYRFLDVSFLSGQERQVAMLFNKKLGFIPQNGVNCSFKVNRSIIDFKFGDDFIEYHPFHYKNNTDKSGRTFEQYFEARRKILDENGYKNASLIVLKNLEEVKSFIENKIR